MRKKFSKINVLFLVLVFLLTLCLSSVKVLAEEGEVKEYNTLEEYLEEKYTGMSKEDIEYFWVNSNEIIKDYTGLTQLTNLVNIDISSIATLGDIDFANFQDLESVFISKCELNGTLNFSNNLKLKSISISFDNVDLSNAVIDIKGLEKLNISCGFGFEHCTGFELEKFLLMENHDRLEIIENEDETGFITGTYRFEIFESIELYLQNHYPDTSRESIEYLGITGTVRDYTGLETLTNLKELSLHHNQNLNGIDFTDLPKLEKVWIDESKLNGILDFSNNTKIEELHIGLKGDLTNAIIDIKGMNQLKKFYYYYYNSIGFDLKKCILMDDYELLDSYTNEDENGMISGTSSFVIYDSIEEYLQDYYSETPREEIKEFTINNKVNDYTGLSTLINLTQLSISNNDNLDLIDFTDVPKLVDLDISNCKLNGTLDFTKNIELKNLRINLTGDLSKSVVNIRGMEWLENFSFCYYNATGFDLDTCILMDDKSILKYNKYEYEDAPTEESYSFFIEKYNNIDEYLDEYYSNVKKEDITYLSIYDYIIIKDYDGLSTLPNLTSLTLYDITNLNQVEFGKAQSLKSVYISKNGFDGTLDFSKNSNLNYLCLEFTGDISKAVVDIRGTSSIESFEYRYSNSVGFDLEKCILMDDYSILNYNKYEYEDAPSQESYSYNIDIYINIEDFLIREHSVSKEDIKYVGNLYIYENDIIKDFSDINLLTNLEYIYITGQKLPEINFEGLTKLKSIQLIDCEISGTLNLSKNTNLEEIIINRCKLSQVLDLSKNIKLSRAHINLTGNLSNAIVNIKGLKEIETFKYEHYNSTGFNLETNILADDYDAFEHYVYENENGDNVEAYTIVKTLTQYLIESGLDTNSDGKLSADEWKKVKNLDLNGDTIKITGIEKAVNLKKLELLNVDPNLIDFSKLSNIEYLSINVSNSKTDFSFPKMSKLETLFISGIDDLNISNLTELKKIDYWDISGKISFPDFEKLEYFYGYIYNNTLDLSKSTNLKHVSLYEIESLEKIVFPENKFIETEEGADWLYIEDIEKEISISKGGSYTFYGKRPICENNNIIDISNIDSYEVKVTGKNVGNAKIKIVDTFGNEFEITITVTDNKVDTTLEDTGITSELTRYGEAILKSNGELWKVNSETTAERVDTNVKKYVSDFVYAKGYVQVPIENTLKKDNTLSVKIEDSITEKVASNVVDINQNLYLTTTGDLYEIGANYITEECSPNKVLTNVKKITNDCIVLKDGTTWYQEPYRENYSTNDVTFKKLADFEIKDSKCIRCEFENDEYDYCMTAIDLNDNLWCNITRDVFFNDSGLSKVKENFKGYEEFNESWNLKLENGNAVYYLKEFNEETGEYEVVSSKVILTDVYQISDSMWADVIIRTDGSIWLYNDANGLTKITKSTDVEEDNKEEEEKEEESLPFSDVSEKAWYYGAVKYNYDNNMIKGLNATTFGPDRNLTRGMLVTILHRMEGSPAVSGASKFSDVQNTKDYYYTAVKWATQNNIISGYNSGKFGPNDSITREQLAVILSKYSKFKGKYKETTASLTGFKDASKISSFAKIGMQWAVGNGVITGNATSKTLNPLGTTTRAEAASMLYKYCKNIGK